jgi:hypothetical protein
MTAPPRPSLLTRFVRSVAKERDLLASRSIPTDSIRTVCVALGPYRNLTTLTGTLLHFHPGCQVLNHAGQRIFGDGRLDWIAAYTEARFESFVRYALHISRGSKGRRGTYGGSIVHSHAFDDRHPAKDLAEAAASVTAKRRIEALFWKESLRTSNHMRIHRVDLSMLLEKEPRLRFLLPIRNPMDCAKSNVAGGQAALFIDAGEHDSEEKVLELVLDEILWAKQVELLAPSRFFCYFEYDLGRETLESLATFLQLTPCEEWMSLALNACAVDSKYTHSAAFKAHFESLALEKFSDFPHFARKLLRFVDGA